MKLAGISCSPLLTATDASGVGQGRSGQIRARMSFSQPIDQQPASGPSSAQLTSKIALIRAPGTWLPKPIVLPSDLHPMPDDITAYFVYPYTLEASSLAYLTGLSAHKTNWDATLESTHTYLEERRLRKENERLRIQKENEERKKESLRLVAPGWSGEMGSILTVPPSSFPGGSNERSASASPQNSI